MHYCFYLITKELPTENQIVDILQPYSEDSYYEQLEYDEETGDYLNPNNIPAPVFTYDWYSIGGRYAGHLKLKVQTEVDDEYQWMYLSKEPREGRLFISMLLKEIRNRFPFGNMEEKWFGYMGDNTYINVDGAKIKDLLNADELGCCGYIDIDGKANVRERWNSETQKFEQNEDFDSQFKETIKQRTDCFITILDIHG